MNSDQAIEQLDVVLSEFTELTERSSHGSFRDLPDRDVIRFVSRARAAIHRIADPRSPYMAECEAIAESGAVAGYRATQIVGVLDSLREDVASGYLLSQRELIHADLFSDFLEMADYLLAEGYKDPAAVVAGSSLEAHLRQLCFKYEIDVSADGKPKKTDRLNSELRSAEAYSKGDQKSVTAWLDLRNRAAHGDYGAYGSGEVALMISSVRDFITRNPA